MPAASVSSSVSWTVYFAASLMLVSMCSPALTELKNYSCDYSAARTGQGAVEVIDSLEPGMVVSFVFHPPGSDDRIETDGRVLTMQWCGSAFGFTTNWQLPHAVLSPEVRYNLSLEGNQVEVF